MWLRLRRFESCPSDVTSIDIDKLHAIDPKPFYRAVLSSHAEGGDAIEEHPLDHRPGLVWNAAIKSISFWFGGRRPGRRPREALLDRYAAERASFEAMLGFDPLPTITLYLDASFHPDRIVPRLAQVPMEVSGEVGLLIPSVIGAHYPWRDGEREAWVVAMSLFDHTLGRAPGKGSRPQ